MRNLAGGVAATASAGIEFSLVSATVAISSPDEDLLLRWSWAPLSRRCLFWHLVSAQKLNDVSLS
jgi:hypothetical protein